MTRSVATAFAVVAILFGGLAAGPALAGPRAGFASPMQPWTSPDGSVHLLRPLIARPTTSDAAVGSLATPGWRLLWDGAPATPGRMVVRVALGVAAEPPQTRATEYLQVGVSRAPSAVRTCLTYGLKGGSGARRPDRVIDGRRFAVWTNADAGMSQQITATDLRAVVGGACYAIERFGYGDSASERNAATTLSRSRGAAMLDAALASLQIGRLRPGEQLQPPKVTLPRGAVAR